MYILILSVLIITSINVSVYLNSYKVLGVGTYDESVATNISEREYWESFVEKHPNYIPAWIELDRYDKVFEIDPNYFTNR